MRYAIAIVGGIIAFVIVGLLQGILIGQMLDCIRKPDTLQMAILWIGQLALPVAVGTWVFMRTARSLPQLSRIPQVPPLLIGEICAALAR